MFAQKAEGQGLEGIFAPQVIGPPWSTLAVAAAHTERLKVGSGIAIAAARSPFETAMAAIDMDRISEGRFVLGGEVPGLDPGPLGDPLIGGIDQPRPLFVGDDSLGRVAAETHNVRHVG